MLLLVIWKLAEALATHELIEDPVKFLWVVDVVKVFFKSNL